MPKVIKVPPSSTEQIVTIPDPVVLGNLVSNNPGVWEIVTGWTQGDPTVTGGTPIVITPPPVVTVPPIVSVLPTRTPDFDGARLAAWPVKAGNIVEATVAGKQALTFVVTPTMTEVAGGRRSEVNLYSQKAKDPFGVWLSQSVYIPASTIPDNPLLYDVITQFHDPNETAASKLRKSPFDLVLAGSNLQFQIRTDKDLNGTKMLTVPVTYDKWMDITLHIVFSGSGKGKLQVWINGKQLLDYSGYVGFSGDTNAPFLKIGDYFFAWNSNDTSQLSYVKSKQRQLSIAGFKIWYE
jgi:hypothetical protein